MRQSLTSRSAVSVSMKRTRSSTTAINSRKRSVLRIESPADLIYALPPWPEWSDAQLNAEKWTVTQSAPPKSPDKRKSSTISAQSVGWYQDPMGHAQLPPTLVADSWDRLVNIPKVKVYEEKAPEVALLDLVTPNTHLLHSEVMRKIIAGLMTLYQLGRSKNLEIEGGGKDFSAPARSWKPWHHVYALCKVVPGAIHKPMLNPSGKYVVRLFYMGCWRRITVDDLLPLDSEGRPLLPMTTCGTEIWPALLAKALLKIASLSWNGDGEIRDFTVIGSLTGWHAQDLRMDQLPPRTIWWLCYKLLTGDSDDPNLRFTGVRETVISGAYETSQKPLSSADPSLGSDLTDPNAEVLGAVVMCALLETEDNTEQYPDHPVLLTEARIFIQVEDDRPPTPVWKTFRWKKWAIDQGIILDESKKILKGIRIFSPIAKLEPDITHLFSESKKPLSDVVSETNTKKEKKIRTKSRTSEVAGITEESIYPEYWVEFEKLVRCLKRFRIYYTTSAFEHNLKVTNISKFLAEKTVDSGIIQKKNGPKNLKTSSSASLMETNSKKGSPLMLYLMMDSMTCKKLLITFSALKPFTLANLDPLNLSCTDLDGKSNTSIYYVMGEEFDWKANSIRKIKFVIKTIGTTCRLLQFRAGIVVFRLWLKLPHVYSLRISSQTPFLLGTKDKIQGSLVGESKSWMSYGANFSSAFNMLAKFDIDCDDHIELLENLCKSYLPLSIQKPLRKYATKLRRRVHMNFENALVELLLEKTTDTDSVVKTVQEWQWLFMNINFGLRTLQGTSIGNILADQLGMNARSPSIRTTAPHGSFTSQLSLSRATGDSVLPNDIIPHKYSLSRDRLSAVYDRLNVISFDQWSGVNFLRRMFGNDQFILRFYPFREDDRHMISYVDYKGIARNIMSDWVPLARFKVNTHPNENPFCSIYLTTPVACAALQVINNDTHAQLPRFLDGVEPSYFPANRHGYIIFAFAFITDDERMKDLQWKITIASNSNENLPHICSQETSGICSLQQEPPKLNVLEIKGHYIPNKDKIIFKCLLTIEVSQTLSMRSVMSNRKVEFVLKIRDNNEQIIKEYAAVGEIIVPLVSLTGKNSGGPEFFVIEAEVIRQSWKLSHEEKMTANSLREKGRKKCLVYTPEEEIPKSASRIASLLPATRKSGNRGRDSCSTIELVPGAPQWGITVVVDEELRSTVTFIRDHREEDRIRKIKEGWEENDPGRYKRSCTIRKDFLENKLYCKNFGNDIMFVQSATKSGVILKNISQKASDQIIVLDENNLTEKFNHIRENILEYEKEYSNVRAEFDTIQWQQMIRMRKHSRYLAELTDRSKEMISGAYKVRDDCIINLFEKIEAEKKAAEEEKKKNKGGKGGKNTPKQTKK